MIFLLNQKLEYSILQKIIFDKQIIMLLGLSPRQKINIPSFESIEFKLSENYISPRNQHLDIDHHYQPGSLTFTQTDVDFKNSLKFIQLPDQDDKQNKFENFQVGLQFKYQSEKQSIKKTDNPQKQKNPQMKKRKSVLLINNLELQLQQSHLKQEPDTKRSQQVVNFKGIQRKKSIIRHKSNSIHSNNNNSSQVQISILSSNKNNQFLAFEYENTENSSLIRKKSISCMKTQDRSIISAVTRSSSKQRLQRCYSLRNSVNKDQKTLIKKANSDRIIKGGFVQQLKSSTNNNNRYKKIQDKIKNYKRKQFLEDPIPLNGIINVKAIKLQQNSQVCRTYLRKIIQNRVSIQHYAENGTNRSMLRK